MKESQKEMGGIGPRPKLEGGRGSSEGSPDGK